MDLLRTHWGKRIITRMKFGWERCFCQRFRPFLLSISAQNSLFIPKKIPLKFIRKPYIHKNTKMCGINAKKWRFHVLHGLKHLISDNAHSDDIADERQGEQRRGRPEEKHVYNGLIYLHSSWSLAVTVSTVCWISSFSSTSASYNALSKYGGLSFLSAIPIRMNFVTVREKEEAKKLYII